MGPALAFVQENAAQENARERAWGAAPKVCSQTRRKLAKSKPSKTTFGNPCILRHHRTFALVLDKVSLMRDFGCEAHCP